MPDQAYGAGNYGALGIVLQQALVISTLTFGAIFALWTQIHHLLLLAGLLSSPALYLHCRDLSCWPNSCPDGMAWHCLSLLQASPVCQSLPSMPDGVACLQSACSGLRTVSVLHRISLCAACCTLPPAEGPLSRGGTCGCMRAGQHQDIVDGAVLYLRLSAPALYCYVVAECLKRYLLAQGVVTPATLVTAFAAALAPLYNWLLVDYFEIGLAGAALANDAVQVFPCCRWGFRCVGSACLAVGNIPKEDCWDVAACHAGSSAVRVHAGLQGDVLGLAVRRVVMCMRGY